MHETCSPTKVASFSSPLPALTLLVVGRRTRRHLACGARVAMECGGDSLEACSPGATAASRVVRRLDIPLEGCYHAWHARRGVGRRGGGGGRTGWGRSNLVTAARAADRRRPTDASVAWACAVERVVRGGVGLGGGSAPTRLPAGGYPLLPAPVAALPPADNPPPGRLSAAGVLPCPSPSPCSGCRLLDQVTAVHPAQRGVTERTVGRPERSAGGGCDKRWRA